MYLFSTARRLFLKRTTRFSIAFAFLSGHKNSIAASNSALTSIRISQASEDHTRVVFDLSRNIQHNLFVLSDPHRIVIDLSNTRASRALDVSDQTTNLMKGIRSAARDSGELRVVLDLKTKVRPRSFILQPDGESGFRLVID